MIKRLIELITNNWILTPKIFFNVIKKSISSKFRWQHCYKYGILSLFSNK